MNIPLQLEPRKATRQGIQGQVRVSIPEHGLLQAFCNKKHASLPWQKVPVRFPGRRLSRFLNSVPSDASRHTIHFFAWLLLLRAAYARQTEQHDPDFK